MAPKTLNITFAADSSQVGSAFNKIESQASSIGSKLTSVGKGLTAAVTLPIIALAGKAVSEASEAKVALGQTEAVIKSTGGAANVTAAQIVAMSDKLGELAGVEGEVVQESSNLLATFTGIRNETGKGKDVFNQAQKAILDMGVAMNNGKVAGLDLQAATIQVGKALNDPIKGMTALAKVGVTFTEGQKEQVKAMVEAGDKMGAQKLILAELNKEFGGSAKAAGENLPPLERLKLTFANLAETIGTQILPYVDRFAKAASALAAKFGELSPAAQKMVIVIGGFAAAAGPALIVLGSMAKAVTALKLAFAGGAIASSVAGVGTAAAGTGGALAALLGPVGLIIAAVAALAAGLIYAYKHSETFRNFVQGAFESVGRVISTVVDNIKLVLSQLSAMWNDPDITSDGWFGRIEAVVGFVRGAFDSLLAWWQAIWPQFSEAISHVWSVISTLIQANIAIIQAAWRLWGDDLLVVARGVWTAISGVIQGAANIISGVIKTVLAIINGDWGRAWQGIQQIVSGVMGAIRSLVQGAMTALRGIIGAGFDGIVAFVRGVPGRLLGALGNLGGLLVGAGRALMDGLLSGIRQAWEKVAGYLRGLANEIRSLKGPIEKDRVLLKPEGAAIMEGLLAGIQSKRAALDSMLRGITQQVASHQIYSDRGIPYTTDLAEMDRLRKQYGVPEDYWTTGPKGTGNYDAQLMAQANRGGMNVTVVNHIAGTVLQERDLANTIEEKVFSKFRTNGVFAGIKL